MELFLLGALRVVMKSHQKHIYCFLRITFHWPEGHVSGRKYLNVMPVLFIKIRKSLINCH